MRNLLTFGILVAIIGCKPQPPMPAEPVPTDAAPTTVELDAAGGVRDAVAARKQAEAEARVALDGWLLAQNNGDFAAYEAMYATPFRGVKRVGAKTEEFDREGWLADRKRMFGKPMKVTADAVSIRLNDNGASVRFIQTWSSGDYKDTGPKELVLERTDNGLRISSEVMLRSTIGRTAKPWVRPDPTDVATLLSSPTIVAFSSEDVLLDPRGSGGCGEEWEDCREGWLELGATLTGVTRKTLSNAQAAEYLGFLTSPDTYGAPPAACYMPRLVVAFYHENETIPWATVGVCIECATIGTLPWVNEVHAAMPEEGSGLHATEKFNTWCERVGLPECVDDLPYHKVAF